MESLKQKLENLILRKDNTIDGYKIKKLDNIIINEIYNETHFCPSHLSVYMRIKAIILPELKEYPKCICNKPVTISPRGLELKNTCGNPECYNKIKANKAKKTCLRKYGVESFTQTDIFKNKADNTRIDKYGNKNYVVTDEFKQKSRKTKLERYGNETFVNIEKNKQTKLERYGDENYNNLEKYKNTCLEKYGVDHVMKVPEIFIKQQNNSYKSGKYKTINYRGSFELYFLQQLDKYHLLDKLKPVFTIKYSLNNKEHLYYPDFIYDNYIIEIKSIWTYDKCGNDEELKKKNDSKFRAASIIKDYNFKVLLSLDDIDNFIKLLIN